MGTTLVMPSIVPWCRVTSSEDHFLAAVEAKLSMAALIARPSDRSGQGIVGRALIACASSNGLEIIGAVESGDGAHRTHRHGAARLRHRTPLPAGRDTAC